MEVGTIEARGILLMHDWCQALAAHGKVLTARRLTSALARIPYFKKLISAMTVASARLVALLTH